LSHAIDLAELRVIRVYQSWRNADPSKLGLIVVIHDSLKSSRYLGPID